jgi:hypothetical protein
MRIMEIFELGGSGRRHGHGDNCGDDSVSRRQQRAHRKPQPQNQNHQNESPAATGNSPTTGYGSCSTTAESTKITHRHGSEPAVPGSLRRAG